MGASRRRRLAPPSVLSWQPDGYGVMPGGDAAGDIQVGESYSVRFVAPEMPGSLITLWFYAVEYAELPGEFVVQRQVEWLTCTDPADPGGTETWSDERCDGVIEVVISSTDEAETAAFRSAEAALGDAGIYAGWDGQPFYGGAS
jgi:hypothetical protein